MMYCAPAAQGQHPARRGCLLHRLLDHGFCRRVAEAKGIERRDGRQVFAWIEEGDEVSYRILRDVCDGIALQIHNIQCWLDPERVCLGGGVSRNPRFIEGVREALARFNAELNYPFPVTEIEPCRSLTRPTLSVRASTSLPCSASARRRLGPCRLRACGRGCRLALACQPYTDPRPKIGG